MSTPLGISGRLAATFQQHALTPLLALVALLLGLFAVLVTPREEEPQINVTMASVLIPFPGASQRRRAEPGGAARRAGAGQIAGIEHTYSVSRPAWPCSRCSSRWACRAPRRWCACTTCSTPTRTGCRRPGHADTDRAAQGHRRRAGAGRHAVEPRRHPGGRPGDAWRTRWRPSSSACPAHARCSTIGGPGRVVQVRWTRHACASAASTCCACSRRWRRQPRHAGRAAWSTTPHRPHAERGDRRVPAQRRRGGRPGRGRAGRQAGLPARGGPGRDRRRAAHPHVWFTPGAAGRQWRRRRAAHPPSRSPDQEAGRERGGRGRAARARIENCATP
jgi:hypothetical protein